MWWGRHFGTRPGDINHMKWNNIIHVNGIPHVKWQPHKTLESSGATVCWPITENAYNQIRNFIGLPDDFCIDVEEKFIPKKNNRKNARVNHYLWQTLNKFFRKIGCSGWGAFYSLRYFNSQETYRKLGALAESLKLGHSITVGQGAYYDAGDHRFAL